MCGSEFLCVCMYVCCQSHISHTNAVVTGVLEVGPVYTQKQPQRLLQLQCQCKAESIMEVRNPFRRVFRKLAQFLGCFEHLRR